MGVHCNRGASYCVTVTGVTVSGDSCTHFSQFIQCGGEPQAITKTLFQSQTQAKKLLYWIASLLLVSVVPQLLLREGLLIVAHLAWELSSLISCVCLKLFFALFSRNVLFFRSHPRCDSNFSQVGCQKQCLRRLRWRMKLARVATEVHLENSRHGLRNIRVFFKNCVKSTDAMYLNITVFSDYELLNDFDTDSKVKLIFLYCRMKSFSC